MNVDEPSTLIFDWDAARERIATAMEALRQQEETRPDVLEEVWAKRAAQLAQTPEREERGDVLSLLIMRLGSELYALDVRYISEIRDTVTPTRVPRTPDWVMGVTSIRGQIYSIVSLRRYLQLNAEEVALGEGLFSHFVMLRSPIMDLVFQVDEVLDVRSVPKRIIDALPGTLQSLPPDYVHGVFEGQAVSDKLSSLVIVLDLMTILQDPRLVIDEPVL